MRDQDDRSKELPMVVGVEHEDHVVGTGINRPETALQALMETAPGHEPAISIEDTAALYLRLADAIDSLPDRERWVFERHHYEGLSFRELAPLMSLGKSTVADIYQSAVNRLRSVILRSTYRDENGES